jgi:spore maturation protein CgeB
VRFLFVVSLHHPEPGMRELPDDVPRSQAESSFTAALRALGHETRVFWRNADTAADLRPLEMTERVPITRAVRALAARVPALAPGVRLRNQRLVEVASAWRPDVVFLPGSNTTILPRTLARLRGLGARLVYACGDSPGTFALPLERRAASLYDLVVTNDAGHAEEWRALGARRVEVLPLAAADPALVPDPPPTGDERRRLASDVGFAGTLVPSRLYRQRVEALEAVAGLGVDLAIWSVHEVPPSLRRFHRGGLLGADMMRALSAARIVPNAHGDTMRDGGNMRMFEACAIGTLQIVNQCPAAARWFLPGTHLVTYQTPDHLRMLVAYYLEHDQERQRIASEGRAHVLAHHTCRHRMEHLVALLTEA